MREILCHLMVDDGPRWKDEAIKAIKASGAAVVASDGTRDYQGSGVLVGLHLDGTYIGLNWSYGSCSGCDGYEDLGTTAAVIAQLVTEIEVLGDKAAAEAWFEDRRGSVW